MMRPSSSTLSPETAKAPIRRTMIGRLCSRFRRDEAGLASIEFAFFAPLYFFGFFWTAELGLIMLKSVMLEHALDVTVRELRLGRLEDNSAAGIKAAICENVRLISDCEENMMIELQPVSTVTWQMPATPVTCVERDQELQPVVNFRLGRQNEVMLVRACTVVQTLFPEVAFASFLNKDAQGGVGITSISAFVNEPT